MLLDGLLFQGSLLHLLNGAQSLCGLVPNAYPFSLQLRACTMLCAANKGKETVLQNKQIGLSSV